MKYLFVGRQRHMCSSSFISLLWVPSECTRCSPVFESVCQCSTFEHECGKCILIANATKYRTGFPSFRVSKVPDDIRGRCPDSTAQSAVICSPQQIVLWAIAVTAITAYHKNT